MVNNINHGYSHAEALEMYPLRYNPSTGTKARLNEIYSDLASPDVDIDDICKEYNINKSVVWSINKGKVYHQNNVNYPVREFFLPKAIRDESIRLLKETNLTGTEIAARFDPKIVNKSTVYNLNCGKIWKDPSLTYPIRDLTVNSPIGR